MSLYEDYRPRSLEEVYGNEDLKRDLEPYVNGSRKLPNALLLIGPSGCGKTTFAEILAAAVADKQDIVLQDAADFRGIDNIRELRRQMRLAPLGSGGRVWILDEAHQLTSDAQNALLSAMEKGPKNVHFILCTTDPQKLLKTVHTRCTLFEVEELSAKSLVEIMKDVAYGELGEEGMQAIPDKVFNSIAKQAGRSGRTAVTMLERILGRDPSEYEAAIDSYESLETMTKDLCQAMIAKKPWKNLAPMVAAVKEDPEKVRRQVLGYMNSVLLSGKDSPQAAVIIECFKEPYYNSGVAGLSLSCYYAVLAE